MEIDIAYYVRMLSSFSGIPARIFQDGRLISSFSFVPFPKDPLDLFRRSVLEIRDPAGYFITPHFHIYGIVNHEDLAVVFGPTAQIPPADRTIKEIAFELGVPKDEIAGFTDAMKSINRMPLESVLTMLCTVDHVLNGEKRELKDVMIRGEEQKTLKKQTEHRRTQKLYETEPLQEPHNTLQLEERIMDIVRRGDGVSLRKWISAAPPVHAGLIAADQLRQLKNTFIVTATLASRAAIRGGMEPEDALTLSDVYIRRAELQSTQSGIMDLQFHMILEFTEQVEKIRLGREPSRLVVEAARYVQRHLSEPIRTEEMAQELYLSRTHLSAKFKQETGMTLTDFILNEKTEEARRLLRYSDKPAAAIGEYLGFSSHSHFSRVFKKYAGMTPKQYREQNAL